MVRLFLRMGHDLDRLCIVDDESYRWIKMEATAKN